MIIWAQDIKKIKAEGELQAKYAVGELNSGNCFQLIVFQRKNCIFDENIIYMRKLNCLIISLILITCAMSCQNEPQQKSDEKTVYLENYINSNEDIMPAIRAALETCRSEKATALVLPEGHFVVKPDFAYEKYCYVSNNDEGLKRIAFDLEGIENLEIKGNDTHLDFVGFIVPFYVGEADDITVSGISIDYTTPFHSEGEIMAVTEKYVDLRFDTVEFPYQIRNGCLYFDNKPTGYPECNNLLEFDKTRREPAYYANDYWVGGTEMCEQLPDGNVRVFHEGLKGTVGNVFVFGCGHRLVPGFIISDSKNVLIHDVNVYHTGGMAFVAQRSENIELNKVNVTCPPNKNRIVSATADATHFSNCSGYIRLIDCVFENQKDDATNIHGIYAMISEIEKPNQIVVKYVHGQQFGFNFIRPQMNLEIVDNESLITNCSRQVESVEVLNKEYTRVVLTEDLPEDVKVKYVVAQTDAYPDVLLKGCTIRCNRARGILLGSRGKIVIDSNYFHSAGASILFEGDGSYWYEQGGVRDVEICRNVFENGNYGSSGWGSACIAVGTGLWNDRETSRYHRNLKIHDNVFRVFDPRILNLYCVDSVDFQNNTIEMTNDYIYNRQETRRFVYENCDGVRIEE